MKNLKSIQSSILRSSKEVLFLTQQCMKHKPTSRIDVRQMLLDTQEKQSTMNSNGITLNLLKFDKEVNLVQYHGLQSYVTKYWMPVWMKQRPHFSLMNLFSGSSNAGDKSSSSSSSSSSNDNDNDTITRDSNDDEPTAMLKSHSTSINQTQTKATVAFMITSQQRQILMSEYSYTKEQIKSMKPNEAQIILQHSIHSTTINDDGNSWKEIVKNILMDEEEKENKFLKMRLQREEQEVQKKQQQQKEMKGDNHNNIEDKKKMVQDDENDENDDILSLGFEARDSTIAKQEDGNVDDTAINAPSLLLSPGSKSLENIDSCTNTSSSKVDAREMEGDSNVWYEVLESSPEEAIVGLCKTKQEAEELLQIKKDLTLKRKNSSTVSLTTTSTNDNTFFIRIRHV